MKKLIISVFILLLLTGSVFITKAAQETCPQDGGWTKIDSDDLSLYPVTGATQYCFKAGSDNSQGCTGGIFNSWPQPAGTCGLSHWAYFIPQVTPTPSSSISPSPTQAPLLTPSNSPTPIHPTPTTFHPSPTQGPGPTATPGPQQTVEVPKSPPATGRGK